MANNSVDRLQGVRTAKAIKAPVQVATTANITLSGEQTVDGVAVVSDDRVLVKDQVTATENGIYCVANGAWTRARDMNKDNDIVEGTEVYVQDGSSGGLVYRLTTDNPSIGVTALNFASAGTFPASSEDNEVPRFNGTNGKSFQGSPVTISDVGLLRILQSGPQIRLDDTNVANAHSGIIGVNGNLVVYADAAEAQANSHIRWEIDGAEVMRLLNSGRLGINDNNPTVGLVVATTDALRIPVGTTGQRPGTPTEGDVRRNSTLNDWEGYDGTDWGSLGGAGRYRGDNGLVGSSAGAADIFRVHEQELNSNVTIAADENAVAVGPLEVASGFTLTVTAGGNLAIV